MMMPPPPTSHTMLQVVDNRSEKYKIFKSCHVVNGSHVGCNRTVNGISSQCYWNRIDLYVKYWIQQCEVCQSNKKLNEPAPALPPLSTPQASCKSEVPQSNGGEVCVLLFQVSLYTGWIICIIP